MSARCMIRAVGVLLAAAAAPLLAGAQTLTALRAEPAQAELGMPVQVVVELDPEGHMDACGLELAFGDGELAALRVSALDLPLKVAHEYKTPGAYTITASGKIIFRGLKTALPCGIFARSAAVNVREPVQEDKPAAQPAATVLPPPALR